MTFPLINISASKVATSPPKSNVALVPTAPSSDIYESSSQYDEPGEAQFWIDAVDLIPDANNNFDKKKTSIPTNQPNSTQVPVTQSQGGFTCHDSNYV